MFYIASCFLSVILLCGRNSHRNYCSRVKLSCFSGWSRLAGFPRVTLGSLAAVISRWTTLPLRPSKGDVNRYHLHNARSVTIFNLRLIRCSGSVFRPVAKISGVRISLPRQNAPNFALPCELFFAIDLSPYSDLASDLRLNRLLLL